jgi:Uma2 family endonuclease
MTTLTSLTTAQAAPPTDPPKRWTTAEFDRLVEEGHIEEGSGIYLWEGQIVEPMSENQPHWNAVTRLLKLLSARLPEEDWLVGQAPPFALEDGTKPHPDIVVAVGPQARYARDPIGPKDAALVIEISGTPRCYDRDRGERRVKYAAASVPQYWIVNVGARRVEVYQALAPQTFGSPDHHGLDAQVPLVLTRDGQVHEFEAIAVADILVDSCARDL